MQKEKELSTKEEQLADLEKNLEYEDSYKCWMQNTKKSCMNTRGKEKKNLECICRSEFISGLLFFDISKIKRAKEGIFSLTVIC